jgi:hypothetical protein
MKKLFYFLILISFILLGIGYLSNNKNSKTSFQNINICYLEKNPDKYINKTLEIEANLYKDGNYFGIGDFYIKNDNCRMNIESWVILEAMTCSPDTQECGEPPKTMSNYMNQKIRLTGTLKEKPKLEYINKVWTTTGVTYIISDVQNVSIISDK